MSRLSMLVAVSGMVFAIAVPPLRSQSAGDEARRRELRDELLRVLQPSRPPATGRINATDRTWEDWVRRTGELPPDFDAMPSVPDLPDPLLMHEGGRTTPVTTAAEWMRQKALLRAEVAHWIFGTMPPPPGNVRATVTASRHEAETTVREVRLEFGPDHRATLRVELVIPDGPGPFPVFLTNHPRTGPWIYTAVRRGYIACVYRAADPRPGDVDDSDAWIELYPQFDWSSLARRAWAASRAIDYLETLPEVDKSRIGLAGHSRNGKQALLAAAVDERIGAVIASSGNSGESDPWRYTTEPFANESIELLAGVQPHWFHPRLRFFAGREDKLPVDQNTLLALVAPRGLMMYSGFAESAGNPFGFEQAYRSARRVYQLLGHDENIWLSLRSGEHETTAGDVEHFMDFLDAVFGRKPHAKVETWILGYTFDGWRSLSGETIDPKSFPVGAFRPGDTAAARKKKIDWALGDAPPGAARVLTSTLPRGGTGDGWLSSMFKRPGSDAATRQSLAANGIGWAELPFGDDLKADLFYPLATPNGKWPVIVWLHGYSYQYRLVHRVAVAGDRRRLPARTAAFVPRSRQTRVCRARVRPDRLRRARARRARLLPPLSQVVPHGQDGDRHARGHRRRRRARRRRFVENLADGVLARREGRAADDGPRRSRARAGGGVRLRPAAARHSGSRRRGDPALLASPRTDAAARVLRRERGASAVRLR